jgi:micrococcal nuclease
MNTVTGFEKKLNRVSRQVKSLIQFIVLILVLATVAQSFYRSFAEDPAIQQELQPSPHPSVLPSPEVQVQESELEQAEVERVVDGDTIRLADGRTLRYIGINTPETVAPNRPVECFGKEASAFNKELVQGKAIWLEKDISETDRYGRLLRYVYLEPSASLSAQVNYLLVGQGYAYASSYPPDVKWQETLAKAQKESQQNQRGLWATCRNEENGI